MRTTTFFKAAAAFSAMAMLTLSPLALAQTTDSGVLLLDASKADFKSSPGVPECVTFANMHGDMSKGAATLMVKMKGGCKVPAHWHSTSEELVLLQGKITQIVDGHEAKLSKAGAYTQITGHHVHKYHCTSKEDCLLFDVADAAFDVHFVDDSGAEITAEKAIEAMKKAEGAKK